MDFDSEQFDLDAFQERERLRLERRAKREAERRAAMIRLAFRATAFLLIIAAVIAVISVSCKDKGEKGGASTALDANNDLQNVSSAVPLPNDSLNMINIGAEIGSQFVVVLNKDSNQVVAAKAHKQKMYPASTTKIMTALVAYENIEDLAATFTMTTEIIDPLYRQNATLAGFLNEEAVTMRDLFYGTILPSGAEAAEGLALAAAGSLDAFVALMNEKVAELGLTGTHFSNVTGLHSEENYSTAYDIAVILKAALEIPFLKEVLSAYQYTTAATPQNPNGIALTGTLFSYMYGTEPEGATILGGKTGYVTESGYCIASYGRSDTGTEYICVTGKGESRWPAVYDQIDLYTNYAK